jgi:hypothetical protein
MLLEIASVDDPRIRQLALRSIDDWIRKQNRSQVKPTGDELRDIRRHLDGTPLDLPKLTRAELVSVVGYWTVGGK